ncbi:MAG TPA: thiopeptide-type bacteriocin biosynthesis protein, partial [Polyangia bacterium]|nr:thiopeptide-type bacteriocin biosynthesis protein [Polyangia bacterium]
LLAGVAMGRLARATAIGTGATRARLAPTWARVAALGRALLDDPEVCARARVRLAPSVVRGATTVRWIAAGEGEAFGEERVVELDDVLRALVEATAAWTPWTDARRLARAVTDDPDEWLRALVDEGLLAVDVTPPLVGPPAASWMGARLARLARRDDAAALARATSALDAGDADAGATALDELPGAGDGRALHGVLVHEPRRTPTLSRAAVERAAALAPLLFRLQDALAPPSSERLAQPALDEALAAATEIFGAGALDLEAFAVGDYGVAPDESDGGARPAPDVDAVVRVIEAVVDAARAGKDEARLDVDALTALFTAPGAAPPPTCELFLTPAREPTGAAAGAGWLLGLHAPAGATWGRFEATLGAPMARALATLAGAERAARPDDETLDVAFAPSPALADLCAHGRARGRVLAISAWSDDDSDLAPRDLELVADPGAAAPLALRAKESGVPVTPSPLARVRSSTAPAGVPRLLTGWSLHRQHAPWALPLGALAALARVPRLTLDGFVVSPATWRLPADLGALRRWRRAANAPRWVQVGHEDRLLPVDLDAVDAARDLAGHERVWEIWPPLERGADAGGRRVEAVVALVDEPDADEARADAATARATREARLVPPPRAAGPARGWRTFEIYGAPEHQDALIADVIAPVATTARRAREIDAWFFQRYVVGPGARHHVRLRVRGARAAFERRLERALAPARAAGAVVALVVAEYHPERARFGDALDAVHAIFEAESVLAGLVLRDELNAAEPVDRLVQLVLVLDTLARGLGLDPEARRALARARRDAEGAPDADERAALDAEFRARARTLRARLGDAPERNPVTRARVAYDLATARATKALAPETRAALAPALLHLACVRLGGPDRALERRAYTFWERALEGLARAPLTPTTKARARRARTA